MRQCDQHKLHGVLLSAKYFFLLGYFVVFIFWLRKCLVWRLMARTNFGGLGLEPAGDGAVSSPIHFRRREKSGKKCGRDVIIWGTAELDVQMCTDI
jgi:hypothetical protein